MAEIVFGLHRRERIACWSCAAKIVPGTHFGVLLTSLRVPIGATWMTFGHKSDQVSQVASVLLSELWEPSETSREPSQVGGQSLSN